MTIRTFIVDDEPLARNYLSSLLKEQTDFELLAEFGDGCTAARAIVEQRPDLVFLDVRMPAMSGVDILKSLPSGVSPEIVFITAFDRYAVEAFEAQALDYLLKPFRRERFQSTIDRIRRKLVVPSTAAQQPTHIAVKCGDRMVIVRFEELDYIRAAANYVQVHAAGQIYEVRDTLNSMHLRLPAACFLRVHRSYVVNLAMVQELFPVGGGEYMIRLRSGKELPVGPTYPAAIRQALTLSCAPTQRPS